MTEFLCPRLLCVCFHWSSTRARTIYMSQLFPPVASTVITPSYAFQLSKHGSFGSHFTFCLASLKEKPCCPPLSWPTSTFGSPSNAHAYTGCWHKYSYSIPSVHPLGPFAQQRSILEDELRGLCSHVIPSPEESRVSTVMLPWRPKGVDRGLLSQPASCVDSLTSHSVFELIPPLHLRTPTQVTTPFDAFSSRPEMKSIFPNPAVLSELSCGLQIRSDIQAAAILLPFKDNLI